MGMHEATASTEEGDNAEVLNRELLEQYRQLKVGLLERLINTYLDEAPVYLAKIRTAVESENFDEIVWGSHSLKSCSGNLGAVRLSHVCQLMENAARAMDRDKIVSLFEKLGPECFEAEEALKVERLTLWREHSKSDSQ
jgi:HPt (histidine-containing phosphotransfer) domain-containing protein